MSKTIKFHAWLLAAFVAHGLPGGWVSSAATGSSELAFYSGYIWRGQVINDEPVLQPAATISPGDGATSFNVWGNFDLTDNGADGDFSEVDLSIESQLPAALWDAKDWDVGVGFIEYLFPNTGADGTREVFLSLQGSYPLLAPRAAVYWDIDETNGDGFYFSFGLARGFALRHVLEGLSAELDFSVAFATSGYNAFYFGEGQTAFNDGNVGLRLRYPVNERLTVGGDLAYTWLWDAGIRDAADELLGNRDRLWGGLTAAYGF